MKEMTNLKQGAGGGADFTLAVPASRPARILQVTDTQIIDASQCRYPGRLSAEEKEKWDPALVDRRMTDYLDGAVAAAAPDLIVHTGDFVYGEFDDSGRMLDRHIAIMESYGIPWTLALGNHERETAIGTERLCRALEEAPHCLFAGTKAVDGVPLEGNGTFSILLTRGGAPAAVLYILDSGCGTAEIPAGIYPRQREWMRRTAARYPGVPAFAFLHIPPLVYTAIAAERYGYVYDGFRPFELTEKGDFGYFGERVLDAHCIDADGSLTALFRAVNVKGVFAGHFHKLSASMLADGIRLTCGLKTGEYDSHRPDRLGGTLMRFPAAGEEGFSAEHIIIKRER